MYNNLLIENCKRFLLEVNEAEDHPNFYGITVYEVSVESKRSEGGLDNGRTRKSTDTG